ncbi:hypothetical protein QZH41_012398, partial [Actinostola sp. cb2023]
NCKCQAFQVCRVNFVDDTHRCECKPRFTGAQCDVEMKPCDSLPCKNGATCANQLDSFTCTCAVGYTGKFCETKHGQGFIGGWVPGRDACTEKGGNLPSIHSGAENYQVSKLHNVFNSYMWIGLYARTVPVNLCGAMVHLSTIPTGTIQNNCKCEAFQVCRVNFVDDTHRCECKPRFTGAQCDVEISACNSSPCLNGGTCELPKLMFGDYWCRCGSNFVGVNCET